MKKSKSILEIKKVAALSAKDLRKVIGGKLASIGTDSKDCTSGLGSGESNTDFDC